MTEQAAAPRGIKPLTSVQAASQTTPPSPSYYSEIYVPRRQAGVVVNQSTALTFAAVFAAIRAISEDIAGLGYKTRQPNPDGTRTDLVNHPATRIMAYPNDETTGYTLRESMQAHALSWGNGYAEIERTPRGTPVALWLLTPDRVTPRRDDDGRIVYQVRNSAGSNDTYLDQNDVLHLHGLGYDGLVGYSVITMAARTIGMGIAGDEYGSATYANRATPSGVLKHPKQLDADGRKNLRDSWEHLYSGPKNASRIAVLEEGLEYESVGLPPSDVQFIENRNFQIEEVARWYRIPPHKLAHIVKSTFNNIEEQNINYVQDALLPWALRWESEIGRKVLAPTERGRVQPKLNLNSLLRGAIEKRFESYVKGRQWGWLSANDVRSFEDMDPLAAEVGDVYLTAVNMTPTERLGEEPPAPPPAPDDDDDTPPPGPGAHLRPVIVDALRRCMTRELHHAKRAPKAMTIAQEYSAWSNKFYAGHTNQCIDALRPAIEASANVTGKMGMDGALDELLALFVDEHIADSRVYFATCWYNGTLGDAAGSIEARAGHDADRLLASLAELITLAA